MTCDNMTSLHDSPLPETKQWPNSKSPHAKYIPPLPLAKCVMADFHRKFNEKLQQCIAVGKGCAHCSFGLEPSESVFESMWLKLLGAASLANGFDILCH